MMTRPVRRVNGVRRGSAAVGALLAVAAVSGGVALLATAMERAARAERAAIPRTSFGTSFAELADAPSAAGVPRSDISRQPSGSSATGFRIDDDLVIRRCGACHQRDEDGRMSRLSYMRKTPEGWQASLRRMVTLHNVRVEPDEAREIVRYLSNAQGLAPEELAPGRFEVERRIIEYSYTDRETESTCRACHSMGRVITQRRNKEEWQLLVATHRALYPLSDFQGFRGGRPPHPSDKAVDHLAVAFPLETPAWTAWSANVRPPRLEGAWTIAGHDPARGPFFGRMTVRAAAGRDDEFETETLYSYAESGATVRRTGRGVVYTGHQWRGRSTAADGSDERREVLSVERGWAEITGRWFRGEYDEDGLDVTLRRVAAGPAITGVHPRGLRTGTAGQEVRVYGANLPGRITGRDVDFGPGVRVTGVSRVSAELVVLRVDVAADAPLGSRDLYLAGLTQGDANAVYDRVHTIRVLPRAGMARIGGVLRPKMFQQFEAVAYHNGRDNRPGTDDDVRLGRVEVSWSIEEYPVTNDDDDIHFIGAIDAGGLFTPALDGPNPARSGHRNNIGDAYVIATYSPAGSAPLRGRAHLLVTVPNYMQWEPWPTSDVNRAVSPVTRPPESRR
jgi:quinohemoprotein amine dehydrogenase